LPKLALLLATLVLAAPTLAADPSPPVRAVAGVFPPFVMEEQGSLTGFSIELWNAVAARMGVPTTIQLVPDTPAAFDALRSGQADVVITGHFYTLERDREFDFSHSIMNTGQQVMVRSDRQLRADLPLRPYLRLLFSRSAFLWLLTAFVLVILPAHLLWFFGKRSGNLVPRDQGYFHGIFHSMAWVTDAMLGQAQTRPQDKIGRALFIAWRFAGVLFVSLFVAKLAATLTLEQFRGYISGPDDLAGRKVATQAGSTSVDHLRRLGAEISTYPLPDEAFAALRGGEVDAVVLAAPALQYYELKSGSGRVKVVGPEFRKSDLGFVVPLGSPLHRKIDSALVAVREDGTYERLRERWFGRE